MPNENGDKWKGIRKLIIGLVVYAGGLYLEITEGTGKVWMWLGAGIAAGGNVWDFVVGNLKIGGK